MNYFKEWKNWKKHNNQKVGCLVNTHRIPHWIGMKVGFLGLHSLDLCQHFTYFYMIINRL